MGLSITELEPLTKAVGINTSELPDRLITTYLRAIAEKLGVDTSVITDNLLTSILGAIIEHAQTGGGSGAGEGVSLCDIEVVDQDYCGPYNITYKAYENGNLVDKTAVCPCGGTVDITVAQGTELFISDGWFNSIGFYTKDTSISTNERWENGGVYTVAPTSSAYTLIIFG